MSDNFQNENGSVNQNATYPGQNQQQGAYQGQPGAYQGQPQPGAYQGQPQPGAYQAQPQPGAYQDPNMAYQNPINYQNNTAQYNPYNANPEQENPSVALGIVGLILGIASIIVCCCAGPFSLILAIPGLICSILQLRKGKSGLAIGGVVCAGLGAFFGVSFLLVIIFFPEILAEFAEGYMEGFYSSYY
ncbi:MAG: hypothetical protein LBM60_02190 [Clostridium sp.]|nr:hypothetical protein [Clostridium sp.]